MRPACKTIVLFTRSLFLQLAVLFIAALALSSLPLFLHGGGMRIAVGLVDEDRTEASAALTGNAKKDALISITEFKKTSDALDLVKSGSLEALFVIRRDYAKNIAEGSYKGVIEAVYSPYSSSVKTLSDAFGVLVLRELMRQEAYARVKEKTPQFTAEEFARVFDTSGGADILSLEVIAGGQAAPVEQPDTLPLPLYLLSLAALFYMLCAVRLPQNMTALAERIKNPGGFLFAYFGVHGLPFLAAALALCITFAFIVSLAAALMAFLAFVLYLVCIIGLLSASSKIPLSDSTRICLMAAFCLLNAVFAYPAGFASFSVLRFLFPAALLQGAVTGRFEYLIVSAAYAGIFLALGAGFKTKAKQ